MTESNRLTARFRRRMALRKLYWTSPHRFEPLFEADGGCWCGKGMGGRIHRSDTHLMDTSLGQMIERGRYPGSVWGPAPDMQHNDGSDGGSDE